MTNLLIKSGPIPTEVKLNQYSAEAKTALIANKDSAIKAAACCYMVLLGYKDPDGPKWLKAQIDAYNARAESHNAPIEARKKEADAFKKAGTVEGHLAFETATSPQHAKEIAVAREELEKDAAQLPAYWTAQLHTTLPEDIEKSEGKRFGVVVKVVLDLRDKKQAALASRYTRVVKWLAEQFEKVVPTYADVVAKLNAVGGFEEALRQPVTGEQGVKFSKAERDAIAKANAKLVTAAANSIAPKAILNITPQHMHKGNVILLGRTLEGGGVAVVGELALSKPEVLRNADRFDDPAATPANPMAEFLSRVFAVGDVVEEKVIPYTDDKGRQLRHIATERKVSLRRDAGGKPQLVVSPRYDDVGMVLHATPMSDGIDLGDVEGLLLLKRNYRNRLRQLVADRIHRRFLEVETTTAPVRKDGDAATSKLGWLVTNTALQGVNDSANAAVWVYWSQPKDTAQLPLDVLPLANLGHFRFCKADLQTAYETWVEKLKDADDKATFAITLLFGTNGLTLRERDLSNEHDLPVTGVLKRGMNLKFAPKDIHAVFKALLLTQADHFEIQPDDMGGMAITWTDELAEYRLFVPTCRAKDLSRTDRLLAPMSAVIAASAEADADNDGDTDEEDVTYEKIISLDTLKAKAQSEASDENCLI
jgi:hypothetical protein